MMMFTEGLDENAISWVKQGSDVVQQPRSPLIEKYPLDDPVSNIIPSCYRTNSFLSPKALPPTKFHSGFLGPRHGTSVESDDERESVASVSGHFHANYSDVLEEEGFGCSSDSDLFERPRNYGCFDSATSNTYFSHEILRGPTLTRGPSKEDLTVHAATTAACGIKGITNRSFVSGGMVPNSRGFLNNEDMHQKFQDLGTPSAPPIVGVGRESRLDLEEKQCMEYNAETQAKFVVESKPTKPSGIEGSSNLDTEALKTNDQPERHISGEGDLQMPDWQTNFAYQIPSYNTSVQSAWQTFIGYDACFRLCLNAWARNCMEAPEFLRDECIVLRNAFGLEKFLLQPRGKIQEGREVENMEGVCTVKGRKMIGQIEVEVKRIRIIPRRKKLRATSSQRAMYMQVGAQYIRHVSMMVKSQINSLTATSFPVAPEETMSCLLQLKSSIEDAHDTGSICVKPGTGDSHVFYPESLGDALLVEVQDINKVNRGRAKIQISSLTDSNGEIVNWWPIYLDDHGRVGKVQLCFSISSTSDKIGSAKAGPVVETLIYDLVLEAALRAQHFNPKNLHINGIWKWLLDEFSDYYGVSDAYAKLRYLSYIMNVATPTKDCFELIHELLLPILKARGEKILTRQERSILLDCEEQIKNLLAVTFENYKSLDELSPTGLTDMFSQLPEFSAPALVPAVQIFSLLHDILSPEAQNMLTNYLQSICRCLRLCLRLRIRVQQTATAKRCRRHMVETDEFMSSNCDGFLIDHMIISTAYLKMKTLCHNISSEIRVDIKIHNQHILPSSIDLPNIAASVYSSELYRRLRGFLASCPPSNPSQHVIELLVATADFERQLDSWNIRQVHGGVVSRDLFHNYIMVWIQDTQLHLLDLCKTEKGLHPGMLTHRSTSSFVENLYDQISDSLNAYEAVIKRWPHYILNLENVVADTERGIMKALEKQYSDILMPLRDGIPKMLEKQVQKLTRRQSIAVYLIPNQLGIFLNTVRRTLDVLHCRVEDILKSWAACLVIVNGNSTFGAQMNGITVMLRKKYKKYMQAIVDKLASNIQANRYTRLKRILEETKEADGETEIRERMQALCLQLTDYIRNVHEVFSSRIFVEICRGFWDKMGQIVLGFLESQKESRIWSKGSDHALVILDDLFASEMQTLQGNSLQDKDLEPPRAVIEARSILC